MQNDGRPPRDGSRRLSRKTPGHRNAAHGERSGANPNRSNQQNRWNHQNRSNRHNRSNHQNRSGKTRGARSGVIEAATQSEDDETQTSTRMEAPLFPPPHHSPPPPPRPLHPPHPQRIDKRRRPPAPGRKEEPSTASAKKRAGRGSLKYKKRPKTMDAPSTDRNEESIDGGTTVNTTAGTTRDTRDTRDTREMSVATDANSQAGPTTTQTRRITEEERTEETNVPIRPPQPRRKERAEVPMSSDGPYNDVVPLPPRIAPRGYVEGFWKTIAIIEIFVNVILVLLIIVCCILFFSGLIDVEKDPLPISKKPSVPIVPILIETTSTVTSPPSTTTNTKSTSPEITTTIDPEICKIEIKKFVKILVIGMRQIDDGCYDEYYYTFSEDKFNNLWEPSNDCKNQSDLLSSALETFNEQVKLECPATTTASPISDEVEECIEKLQECKFHRGIREIASDCKKSLLYAIELGITQECDLENVYCKECSDECDEDTMTPSIEYLYYEFYDEKKCGH